MVTSKTNQTNRRDYATEAQEYRDGEEYRAEFPHIATKHAMTVDVWRRAENGLERSGAIKRFGRRFYFHRQKYTQYKLGQRT
jgi:hypothetical protein